MVQPQTLRLRQLLARNVIGRVQTVIATCEFPFATPSGEPLERPGNIHFDPARGGGALLDAGTYAVSLARLVTGEAPSAFHAVGRVSPGGVDLMVAATLDFPGGALAQITCSLASTAYRNAVIIGDTA